MINLSHRLHDLFESPLWAIRFILRVVVITIFYIKTIRDYVLLTAPIAAVRLIDARHGTTSMVPGNYVVYMHVVGQWSHACIYFLMAAPTDTILHEP